MDTFTVAEVASELQISRSHLYRIIKDEEIVLDRTDTGRYVWNKKTVEQLKLVLDVPSKAGDTENVDELLKKYGLKRSFINNRRYLGNKYTLTPFIKEIIEKNCTNINIVTDIFSGTGAVADAFKDKMLITNDILYSNYLSNVAFFEPMEYSKKKIIEYIYEFNKLNTNENNYMRKNFAETFFSADVCSKIGYVREQIEKEYNKETINLKEYAILITSLLYGMDRIANTVGHYDAYRKNSEYDKELILPVLLPDENLNSNNKCFNMDANILIKDIECDLLYLDPPYNSRQYCDAYHLLENVARWEKPEVYGIARKMDRSSMKSEYCKSNAAKVFENLINNANAKYIMLSYNNMSNKGNERSNAKITDKDIFRILNKKGKTTVFEKNYKSFSAGKSNIEDNNERLFLCEVYSRNRKRPVISSPLNYTGGKNKIISQLKPIFANAGTFLDIFCGGCNVGINSDSTKIIFNDINKAVIELMEYIKVTDIHILLNKIYSIIEEYGLSRTDLYGYEFYQCNSVDGLAKYNKEGFLNLREKYNLSVRNGNKDLAMLYVLIVYSFNNQIRFNRKGEFNLPVGKRDFNIKMKNKLLLFSEELKKRDIHFSNKDFREIDLFELTKDTFIYCDPPYLITTATYNESGLWTPDDETDLLDFLDYADSLGLKFALSNVMEAKDKENVILKSWVKEKKFMVHYLVKSYSNSNYQRKRRDSNSEEVLITNY